jgi:hypothetical protein
MEQLEFMLSNGYEYLTCVPQVLNPRGGSLYLINREGSVYSVRSKRFINQNKHSLGYRQFYLTFFNGGGQWYKSHRLVALQFIPNPKNLSDVNHKNGIKHDNRVENLEWMSHSDNVLHSYKVLGRDKEKIGAPRKKILCINTGEEFLSLKLASIAYDLKSSNVCMCCKGKLKETKGYSFRYV